MANLIVISSFVSALFLLMTCTSANGPDDASKKPFGKCERASYWILVTGIKVECLPSSCHPRAQEYMYGNKVAYTKTSCGPDHWRDICPSQKGKACRFRVDVRESGTLDPRPEQRFPAEMSWKMEHRNCNPSNSYFAREDQTQIMWFHHETKTGQCLKHDIEIFDVDESGNETRIVGGTAHPEVPRTVLRRPQLRTYPFEVGTRNCSGRTMIRIMVYVMRIVNHVHFENGTLLESRHDWDDIREKNKKWLPPPGDWARNFSWLGEMMSRANRISSKYARPECRNCFAETGGHGMMADRYCRIPMRVRIMREDNRFKPAFVKTDDPIDTRCAEAFKGVDPEQLRAKGYFGRDPENDRARQKREVSLKGEFLNMNMNEIDYDESYNVTGSQGRGSNRTRRVASDYCADFGRGDWWERLPE